MKVAWGKSWRRISFGILFFLCFVGLSPVQAAALPGWDPTKMSDMSTFDPNNPVIPTGDTVKVGLMEIFSGPGASVGDLYWLVGNWVAHDLNQRGGILVDGKKKKIQVLKGDTQGKQLTAKKETERLILEEKVNALFGATTSPLSMVVQQVAGEYKTIYMNAHAISDELMNAQNFNRYVFRTAHTTTMCGDAFGYYYSRRPEKKFYILCQDMLTGHSLAEAFKKGLKKYKPEAMIVGEAFHPLFLKDFAPYLTKIQGSGAEVIFTSDFMPDSDNLILQMKSMGINIPLAHLYADNLETYKAIGGPAGRGMVNINKYMIGIETAENKAFVKAWSSLSGKWKKPYDTYFYRYPVTVIGSCINDFYWLYNVMERAGSTDPEKIIKVWEGDEFKSIGGPVKMRACDHQVITNMYATEFEFPNPWFKDIASYGKPVMIPPQYCTAPIQDLDRCKKKGP